MENVVRTIGSYVVSILFFLVGINLITAYLFAGEDTAQPVDILLAGLVLFSLGVLTMPFILAAINRQLLTVLMVIGIGVSLFLGFRIYNSIDSEIKYQAQKEQIDATVVQRLKDIRDIQTAYMEVKGKYSSNWDSLRAFVNQKNIPQPYESGRSDSLTTEQLIERGKIITKADVDSVSSLFNLSPSKFESKVAAGFEDFVIRDTTYASLYELNFAKEVRAQKNLPTVDLDSIPYTPSTGKPFKIELGEIETGGVTVSTIQVTDPSPFGRKGVKIEALKFGSLDAAHTDGNWKD